MELALHIIDLFSLILIHWTGPNYLRRYLHKTTTSFASTDKSEEILIQL